VAGNGGAAAPATGRPATTAEPDDRLPGHVPPTDQPEPTQRPRRALGWFALVLAVTLVAAASAAMVVFVLLPAQPNGGQNAGPDGSPVAIPSAALLLRLRDDGTSLTLEWTDPSGGAAPFVITGSRAGQGQSTLHTVSSGTTRYTLNGLDTRSDWCFAVAAVYSAQRTVLSELACTHRLNASAGPTGIPSPAPGR
jgi:hypothetical protein